LRDLLIHAVSQTQDGNGNQPAADPKQPADAADYRPERQG
jgi:hypothetical protein